MLINGDDDITLEAESTTPRVLTVLSFVLERLVARNDQVGSHPIEPLMESGKGLSVFHGVRAPNISIFKYLERIYKYVSCSPSCFVVGFVYIDRLMHKHPDSLVMSLNVHRLIVTSVMVASKVLDDVHYNNAFYARVGGVSNAELNRLELELLFLLDFGVTVSSRVFESYCLHLEKEMMWSGVGQRIEQSMSNPPDDETEISVGDTQQSSSPPPHVID
ncbi:cyclin-U1-1-like [Magnolia sinica]|uniref:cyclin-U1-1-like n=1 Tax=Magnolia sinica TaxID=86752 RepID=UPI002657B009|nr:cyclin-U1-1-like [Magnolia sinica]